MRGLQLVPGISTRNNRFSLWSFALPKNILKLRQTTTLEFRDPHFDVSGPRALREAAADDRRSLARNATAAARPRWGRGRWPVAPLAEAGRRGAPFEETGG